MQFPNRRVTGALPIDFIGTEFSGCSAPGHHAFANADFSVPRKAWGGARKLVGFDSGGHNEQTTAKRVESNDVTALVKIDQRSIPKLSVYHVLGERRAIPASGR